MKSYTDIEQSKKLAEFLSLESADAFYVIGDEPVDIAVIYGFVTYKHLKEQVAYKRAVPCWSLAALLNIIPKRIKEYNILRIDIDDNGFAIWYDEIGFGVNNDLPDIVKEYAIDACVEMILKLKEKGLI